MRMKIELSSHELQIVMNALDRSHKRSEILAFSATIRSLQKGV